MNRLPLIRLMKEDMNRLRLLERYEQIAINTVDEGRYEPIKIDR